MKLVKLTKFQPDNGNIASTMWTVMVYDQNGGIGTYPFVQKLLFLKKDLQKTNIGSENVDYWWAGPGDVLLLTGKSEFTKYGRWFEVLIARNDYVQNLWGMESEMIEFLVPLQAS